MATEFDRVNGTTPHLDRAQRRIQDGTERSRQPSQDGADLDLTIVTDPASATPNEATIRISHKLQRRLQGHLPSLLKASGPGTLSLESSDAKGATFKLSVPAGAAATTHKYKIRAF